MASTRTRTRSRSSVSRRSARSSSSGSNSSQTVVLVGAAAILVVVIMVVVMKKKDRAADSGQSTAQPVSQPVNPGRPPVSPSSSSGAVSGRQPLRPAPALDGETLNELDRLLAEAKKHYNEGVRLRTAGENRKARQEQATAKELLDQWESLVADQLAWQEEADMEDWAQPASYSELTRRYTGFSSLQKRVRMGGGR